MQMRPQERFGDPRDYLSENQFGDFYVACQTDEVQAIVKSDLARDGGVGRVAPDRAEYLALVVFPRVASNGVPNAIRALKAWRHYRPHWRRIRRRICDHCKRRDALSEPRFLVCSGCGVARYCSEECQILNWGHHQTCCAALARHVARQERTARHYQMLEQYKSLQDDSFAEAEIASRRKRLGL